MTAANPICPMPNVKPMVHGGTGRSTIQIARNFSEISDANVRSAINGLIKSIIRKED